MDDQVGQEMINAAVNRPREEQRRAVERKKPTTSSLYFVLYKK